MHFNEKSTNRKWMATGMRVIGKYVERAMKLCVNAISDLDDRSNS